MTSCKRQRQWCRWKKLRKMGINTLISCHTSFRPAHQAQFGVQYLPQEYFDLQRRNRTSNLQTADRPALLPKATATPNKMEKSDCTCEITDTRAAGCVHRGQPAPTAAGCTIPTPTLCVTSVGGVCHERHSYAVSGLSYVAMWFCKVWWPEYNPSSRHFCNPPMRSHL